MAGTSICGVPANLPFVTGDPTPPPSHPDQSARQRRAARWESGVITIEGSRTRDAVLLSIRDQGQGCHQPASNAFSKLSPRAAAAIGMAAAVSAWRSSRVLPTPMGITASACNHEDGGAVFTLRFPASLIASQSLDVPA